MNTAPAKNSLKLERDTYSVNKMIFKLDIIHVIIFRQYSCIPLYHMSILKFYLILLY